MRRFVYAAWFRDMTLQSEDEDCEWVACFEIEADLERAAQQWGDYLAKAMCGRRPDQEFLSSEVRTIGDPMYADTDLEALPKVQFGQDLTDEEIGW